MHIILQQLYIIHFIRIDVACTHLNIIVLLFHNKSAILKQDFKKTEKLLHQSSKNHSNKYELKIVFHYFRALNINKTELLLY